MRQAIRVYSIVALVLLGAFIVGNWALPKSVTEQRSWVMVAQLVFGVQLWVLLVIPLGVLAGSDAAQAGRRGWLAAFIALIALAPIAAKTEALSQAAQALLTPSCSLPDGFCTVAAQPQLLIVAEWVAALLLVPLAALIYSFTSGQSAPRTTEGSGNGERRLIIACAVAGIVVMSALGFLATTFFIERHVGSGTIQHILYTTYLQGLVNDVWLTLLDALPVAAASVAMVHAARTGRRAWLAGLIVLVVLAVVAADPFDMAAYALIGSGAASSSGGALAFQGQLQVINGAAPVVVMLVVLLYALTTRPRQHAPALAGA